MNDGQTIRHWRPLAYNVTLWVFLSLAGFVTLVLVRQYGQALTSKYDKQVRIEMAWKVFDEGRTTDSQKALLPMLSRDGKCAQEVLERFGMELMAMPKVYDAVITPGKSAAEAQLPFDSTHQIARMLVAGKMSDDESSLGALIKQRRGRTDVSLWLGRARFAAGDLPGAKTHYDRFWAAFSRREREAWAAKLGTHLSISGNADETASVHVVETIDQLMWAGLWNEAFAAAQQAKSAGLHRPELTVFEAIQREMADDKPGATQLYATVLRDRPTHALTLVRLCALMSGNS